MGPQAPIKGVSPEPLVLPGRKMLNMFRKPKKCFFKIRCDMNDSDGSGHPASDTTQKETLRFSSVPDDRRPHHGRSFPACPRSQQDAASFSRTLPPPQAQLSSPPAF